MFRVVWSELLKLYRSFLKWNVYKILSIIPLLIAWIPLVWYSFTNNSFIDIFSAITWVLFNDIISLFLLLFWIFQINILLVGAVVIFILWYAVSKVLFTKVHLLYITKKKVTFSHIKKDLLKQIYSYLKLFLIHVALLLIPIAIFVFCIALIIFFGWWEEQVVNTIALSGFSAISILTLILFIVCIVGGGYFYYRIMFSTLILIDAKKSEQMTSWWAVKKSFFLTKSWSSLGKFLGISVVYFLVFSLPLSILHSYISYKWESISTYIVYTQASPEQIEQIPVEYKIAYENLALQYQWVTLDQARDKLFMLSIYYYILNTAFFLFIFWIYGSIMATFYKKILK